MTTVAVVGSLREGREEQVVLALHSVPPELLNEDSVLLVHDRPGVNAAVRRFFPNVQRGDPLNADIVILVGRADDEWLEEICGIASGRLYQVSLPLFVQWKDTSSGSSGG